MSTRLNDIANELCNHMAEIDEHASRSLGDQRRLLLRRAAMRIKHACREILDAEKLTED